MKIDTKKTWFHSICLPLQNPQSISKSEKKWDLSWQVGKVTTMVVLASQFCLLCPWAVQAGAAQRCEGEGGTPLWSLLTKGPQDRLPSTALPPMVASCLYLAAQVGRFYEERNRATFFENGMGEKNHYQTKSIMAILKPPWATVLHKNTLNLVGEGGSQPAPGNCFCLNYIIVVNKTFGHFNCFSASGPFTMLYNRHRHPFPEILHLPKLKLCTREIITPHRLPPSPW